MSWCPCDCGCDQYRVCSEERPHDREEFHCRYACHCVVDNCQCADPEFTAMIAGAEQAMVREGLLTPSDGESS